MAIIMSLCQTNILNPVIQDPLFQPADGLLVYDVSRECVVVKSNNMTPKYIEFR